MSRFRPLLDDGRVHLFDGAMGTVLYGRGFFVNVCYDELNLTEPDMVLQVHREYVEAGAEALETNTFGANPVKLSSWGLADETEAINRAAAELAREAAGNGEGSGSEHPGERSVAVMGAVGPLGIRIEPFGPTSESEARAHFRRQIAGLAQGGVDGFVLETFSDPDELHQALLAAREVAPDLPVVAQMTVGEEGTTSYGTEAEQVADLLSGWGADVVGLNCSVGPASMLEAVERMTAVTDLPISAQPNAGMPRKVGDRKIYMASPDYMATYARRLIEAGVRFVGGCCGTTPEHIERTGEAVDSLQPKLHHARVKTAPDDEEAVEPAPVAERSEWGRKLADGERVTSLEISPPRGWKTGEMLESCRRAKEAGVDAVSVLDSPRAQGRMGVIPAAAIIEDEVGIDTVIHYTCRDRNMLGMISDLLGAAAAGLRNVLIVSGDPPVTGPYKDSTAVFDIDSIGLVNVVHGLNRGLDPGGGHIDEPTRWVTGVALNPSAVDRERELERWHWKVDAGADFAVTQAIFDVECLERFLDDVAKRDIPKIPVVAGLWPLTTSREAEYLANEVPGVSVPNVLLERVRSAEASGADSARREGIAIARELREALRPITLGIHLTVPGNDVEAALEVVED